MGEAFIIMQIGNVELDRVYAEAIVPAVEASELAVRRVDQHNQGGLLKSEIIDFIQRADIIVADLTNERPNCYLEVGYAMGLDKFRNLILTAREDHHHESANYVRGGPRIHFDLIGYDILFWHQDALDEFQAELEQRIRRRSAVLAPSPGAAPEVWDAEWIESHRQAARAGLENTEKSGFMEIRFALDHPKIARTQTELDAAARDSPIHTSSWPIAVYLGNNDEYRPRPRSDGITAVIGGDGRGVFDYWTVRKNGDFYLLRTLIEDDQDPPKLFYNTRIIQVTETLLYCVRLYTRLAIDPTHGVHVTIRHGGLRRRILDHSQHRLMEARDAVEDEVEESIHLTIGEIEPNLVGLVKELVAPLLVVFDLFEVSDDEYGQIVNAFVGGQSG